MVMTFSAKLSYSIPFDPIAYEYIRTFFSREVILHDPILTLINVEFIVPSLSLQKTHTKWTEIYYTIYYTIRYVAQYKVDHYGL